MRLLLLLCCWLPCAVQAQSLLWHQALGGSAADNAQAFRLLPGGSVAIAGSTRSNDGMLAGQKEALDLDAWLVKMTVDGKLLWQQRYGGSYNEEARDVRLLPDGGFALAGHTDSREWSRGGRDMLLVRTDALGRQRMLRSYGGAGNDKANALLTFNDGSYLLVGETGSTGGEVGQNHGGLDGWIVRVEADGRVRWARTYGGTGNESIAAVLPADDGGFYFAAYTDSQDGDVKGVKGKTDIWIIKTDAGGNIQWQRTLGGTGHEEPHAMIYGPDRTLLIAGTTFSHDGDVQAHRGGGDMWVICLDQQGNMKWNACYGGSGDEGANALALRRNGQILVAGMSRSRDGHRRDYQGIFDGWLVCANAQGQLQWQQSLGGFDNDAWYGVAEVANTDIILAGQSASRHTGDMKKIDTYGGNDFWVALVREPTLKPPPRLRISTILAGYVKDKTTGRYVHAEVSLIDTRNKQSITLAKTDSVNGLYQILLDRTLGITLMAVAPGYMLYSRNLQFTEDEAGAEQRLDIELEPIAKDQHINLYHIYFDIGRSTLRPESELVLERLLAFMKMNPKVSIRVGGHTDGSGAPSSKQQLSLYRALEVRAYLVQRGIYDGRMVCQGYGMSRPLVQESDEESRAQNRRVEIEITGVN